MGSPRGPRKVAQPGLCYNARMDPVTIKALIPIVSVLAVFGAPVALVFVSRYFKLKHRELEIDAEIQKKFTEEARRGLEARVTSLESAMQMVLQVVGRGAQQQQAAQAQPLSQLAQVAEPPPDRPASQPAPGTRERG